MEDDAITEIIIGCAFEAHNKLGPGFLEKVYENALCLELKKKGLKVKQQEPIKVWYEGRIIDPVAGLFLHHGSSDQICDLSVRGPAPHRLPQIVFHRREKARSDLAVGGKPDAGTRSAETLSHRGDDPDRAG